MSKFWMLSHPTWESDATEKSIRPSFGKIGLEQNQLSVILDKSSFEQESSLEDNEENPTSLPVNRREC